MGIVSGAGVAEVCSAALGSFDGAIEGLRKIAGLFSILAGFRGDFSVSTGRSIKLVTGLGWLSFSMKPAGQEEIGAGWTRVMLGWGHRLYLLGRSNLGAGRFWCNG